jgi:hypothetical protein
MAGAPVKSSQSQDARDGAEVGDDVVGNDGGLWERIGIVPDGSHAEGSCTSDIELEVVADHGALMGLSTKESEYGVEDKFVGFAIGDIRRANDGVEELEDVEMVE